MTDYSKLCSCLDRPDDPKDKKDYLLSAILPMVREVPEDYMGLKDKLSKVGYQKFGSCTSWSSVNGIKEFQEGVGLSEYFNYVNSKKISGDYTQEGEYIKNSLKAICDYGVCEQDLFSDVYPPSKLWIDYIKKEPLAEAYENAKKYKGKTYWKVGAEPQSFKEALWLYKAPVVFAMTWYKSYNNTPKSGILPLPSGGDVGGHAISAIGYDKNGLWVKNSWGCYDKETEILTKDGWKLFKDIENDEIVATLNQKNHFLEYQKIDKKIVYDYDNYLWNYKGRDIDLLITPNHKLYIKSIKKTDWKLIEADKIQIKNFKMKKDAKWSGVEKNFYQIGQYKIEMNLWLEFLGYFLSEGHTTSYKFTKKGGARVRKYKIKGECLRNKETGKFIKSQKEKIIEKLCLTEEKSYDQISYIVGISQKKGLKANKIQKCLEKLPFKFTRHNHTWTVNNKVLFEELKCFGKSSQKFIPDYAKCLLSEQLKILLDALMLGDGSGYPLKKWVYYTSSKKLADDVQEILLKVGYAGDISWTDRRGRKMSGGTIRFIEYRVNIKVKELEQLKGGGFVPKFIPYKGKVYCVEVPNHILYVRRNGKAVWSGNSNWGNNGFFYIPFGDWQKHQIYACWVLLDVENNPMLKLIRQRGRKEVFAIINGRNYYIGNESFEDLLADKLVSWEDVKEVDNIIELHGVIK